MSQATVDPTLEALVPRGSAWRSAGLVVLALALLVGAWLLPPTLKPGIGEGFGASWQEFAAEKRVVLLAQVHPSGLGGVRVRAVDDLPGAHVVDAWVVDGDLWSTMPAEMPTTAVASIHNDPEEGGPSWIRGFMLDTFDQDAGDVILELAGPGSGSPFLAVEIRQLGGATARDTADGSAVGGRDSGYTLSLLSGDPSTFAEAAPARAQAIAEALQDRISAVTNVNFAGDLDDRAAFERVWPPAVFERLQSAREQWDPDRVFAFGPA